MRARCSTPNPDAYYRALEQTRSDQTRTTIVDDCPVCHFQFFSCLHTEPVLLVTCLTLLGSAPAAPETHAVAGRTVLPSLRAPPVSGLFR